MKAISYKRGAKLGHFTIMNRAGCQLYYLSGRCDILSIIPISQRLSLAMASHSHLSSSSHTIRLFLIGPVTHLRARLSLELEEEEYDDEEELPLLSLESKVEEELLSSVSEMSTLLATPYATEKIKGSMFSTREEI